MAEPVKVLTENAAPIPDVTPKVAKLEEKLAEVVAEKGVSRAEHAEVQSEIDVNAAAISELQRAAKDASATIAQAAADAVEKLKEAAGTASTKVTDTAHTAADKVTTINQGRPVAPTTTMQEDITTSNQRLLLLIGIITTAAIAFTIAVGAVGLAVYLGVTGHTDQFPDTLKTALIFVLGYFMKGNVTTMPTVPSFQSRSGGGPVTAGQPYNVGEHGPERIIPKEDGHVTPNKDLPKAYVMALIFVVPATSLLGIYLFTR